MNTGQAQNPDFRLLVIGAGPAGLAATYTAAKKGIKTRCFEKDRLVGGISRTVIYRDFRFDIGGHRFFTKYKDVDILWHEILGDDFLVRPRLSRIYYKNKFFNYPLKPLNALKGLGPLMSAKIMASFLKSRLFPFKEEISFEHWVTNRFGKKLYELFFKTYTEKVWGIPCTEISAEWAAQRIKGLSLSSAVIGAFFKSHSRKFTTLIEEFKYPRYGPGQMYETMTEKAANFGASTHLGEAVCEIQREGNRLMGLKTRMEDREVKEYRGDYIISSMPISSLVLSMRPLPPEKVITAAKGLAYRSIICVNLLIDAEQKNPDTWVYVHSPEVATGRIQFYKNWSPWMIPRENQSSLGMEYFCTEGDAVWRTGDKAMIEQAKNEVEKLRLIDHKDIFDAFVVRMPKCYPVYDSGYSGKLAVIREFLETIENLQPIGRNGMFKYNNADHSILTALYAIRNLNGENLDIWGINTGQEYHEEKRISTS